uniref:Mre11 DNA-binding domain-containing protein n=1 Tax=Plectus sambesii TaxID=2011161 RepID=A0A914XI45_9BILA
MRVVKTSQSQAGDPAEVVKILVASDIHVGFSERDPVRFNDSVNTFEEVLKLAQAQNVDMVLFGGDLYHENRPSREAEHRVMRLLRKYCLSDKAVPLQFISDPSVNFHHSLFPRVNYEDPNLNVGMPVFTIHGNHDDLAGKGLSAVDLLHESGLLNLFGKFTDIEKFEVSPILLKKGNTRIALYGISSQRDDRLFRAFHKEEIKFLRPKEDSESWFNILVLHQNRPRRSEARNSGACVPDRFIPQFFDLCIWGHEHECKIEPQYYDSPDIVGNGIFMMQPGSTIATSLSPEEAGEKKVAVLSILQRKFQSSPIALRTVRQFFFDELTIDEGSAGRDLPKEKRRAKESDEELAAEKVREMIALASRERHSDQPKLPLIRLRITYSGQWINVAPFNVQRFGQQFVNAVANPRDLIIFKKQRAKMVKGTVDKESLADAAKRRNRELQVTVEDIVKDYFRSVDNKDDKLMVLGEAMLGKAVADFVAKDVDSVIVDTIKEQLKKAREYIVSKPLKVSSVPSFDENGEPEEDSGQELEILENLAEMRDCRLEAVKSKTSQADVGLTV